MILIKSVQVGLLASFLSGQLQRTLEIENKELKKYNFRVKINFYRISESFSMQKIQKILNSFNFS